MTAMIGFGIVTGIGFVILLISLVFDGVIDIFDLDFGSGIFSMASIGGLITGIGLGGIIGTSLNWSVFYSMLLGLGIGVVIAIIAVAVYNLLKQAEVPQEAQSLETIVGLEAVVTLGAEAGDKGMIQVRYLGTPKTMTFISDLPLRTGDVAIITKLLSPDSVRVIPNPAV
jgi:MFS family permease